MDSGMWVLTKPLVSLGILHLLLQRLLVASLTLPAALLTARQALLAACATCLLFEVSRTGSNWLWRRGVAREV